MHKKNQKSRSTKKKETKQEPEDFHSLEELLEAWSNLKPVIPLSFILASSEAARNK